MISEDGSHRTLRDEAVRVFGLLLEIESRRFESYRDEAFTLQVITPRNYEISDIKKRNTRNQLIHSFVC